MRWSAIQVPVGFLNCCCGQSHVTHDSAVVWISNVIVSEEMMIFLLFSLKWVYANKNYEMTYYEH